MKNKIRLIYAMGIIMTLGVFLFLGKNGKLYVRAEGEVLPPAFSQDSGIFNEEFTLELTAQPGDKIYYTTDGSIPCSKEEEALKPTPTPLPEEELIPDEKFDVSSKNTYFGYEVEPSDVANGTKLVFESRYRSICFFTPEGVTDWSNYTDVVVEYSVNESNNGKDVGLQACPIFAGSPDSWGDGIYRSFEARTSADVNSGRQKWEISLEGKNVGNIGWLMLGVTNENTSSSKRDTITVHSITLIADKTLKLPNPKLDTIEYSGGFLVKNRNGEDNILSAKENIKLMSSSGYCAFYVPRNNQVPKATVIRAMAVDAEGNKSSVVTKTYFVGNKLADTYKNASVISIVTDPNNLLSNEKGVYRIKNYENKGADWERPAFVEYFEEDGTRPFATEMGMRLHGSYSRHFMQKSFNLYFREELGLKNLKYELIPGAKNFEKTAPTAKYKNFMLRNGGNDTEYTKLQDVFIQSLVEDRAYATQSARPCVLFLNGEYWGPYNLTEKYSDNYLEEEFGVNKDNVVVIKEDEVDEGNAEDIALYQELQKMAEWDMTKQENYDKFCQIVDIQSYIDYYATEIYIGNYDWPEKNTQLWRVRVKEDGNPYADTKWRWILYDTEYSMGLYDHSTGSPIRWAKENDSLFKAVSKNPSFRERFVTVMCDLMNKNFRASDSESSPSETIQSLHKYAAIYRPLMTQYYNRFGYSYNKQSISGAFDEQVTRIKDFINNRRVEILDSLKTDLLIKGGHTKLTLKSNVAKEMNINTTVAKLSKNEWTGTYFNTYSIDATAPVVRGYTFTGWKCSGLTATSLTDRRTTVKAAGGTLPILEALYTKDNAEPTPTPSRKPTASPTSAPGNTKKVTVPKASIRSLKSKKKKTATLAIKKVNGAKGYQVVYAVDKKVNKSKKSFITKKKTVTVKNLKSRKKYYIKVRAYKVNAKGKKVYGKYSAVKSIKIK